MENILGLAIVLAVLFSPVIFLIVYFIRRDSATQKKLQSLSCEAEKEQCELNCFVVSKEIVLYKNLYGIQKFLVDDKTKKFGIFAFDMKKKMASLQVWTYASLLDFNLFEDGNKMLPGRGLTAAAGALLFGTTGAIIGSVAGGKKIEEICNRMTIQIKVNDLENPLISIDLLSGPYSKEGSVYQDAKKTSDQIIATLTYIESNKNASL